MGGTSRNICTSHISQSFIFSMNETTKLIPYCLMLGIFLRRDYMSLSQRGDPLGSGGNRCIKMSPSVPLQLESSPIHSRFQSHSSVTSIGTSIACISERNLAHIWLGEQYSTTLDSDDVILLAEPLFEPELPYPSIFIVCSNAVYWFVCSDTNHWNLSWSYPSTQTVYAIFSSFNSENKTYSVYLLLKASMLQITDISIDMQDQVIFNSDNAKTQEFSINFFAEYAKVLYFCCFENRILICTTASLSLHLLSEDKQSISHNSIGGTRTKFCIFVMEISLIILLTQTGRIQFIDSNTLTLCDEWSDVTYDFISLLSEGESNFLVCQKSLDSATEFSVVSLQSLVIVASYSLKDTVTSLITSNDIYSTQFCFYTLDSDTIKLYFCDLNFVSKKIELDRTMANFSILQACVDQGFDWVSKIIENINTSQFQTACYLLWRHFDSIQFQINDAIFTLLLDKIQVIDNVEGVILWVRSLLLFISLHEGSKHSYLAQIIEWTETYVENLEKNFTDNWIQLALKLIHFLNAEICVIDSWEANKRLIILQNQIEDIQIVFNTLNIRLSFSRIADYSLSSFLHQLLRHAHSSEQIRSLLTSKIISIINRHGESLDNVLYNYILSLDGKLNQEVYRADLLESKAIAVAKFISSNDLKHKSTIFLLRHARLPINKKLLEFANEIENSTRMSMQHEIELVRVLSIFKENSIDIPVLHSPHQLDSIIQNLQASCLTESIHSIAKHANISDDLLAFIIHSSQLSISMSIDDNSYSKSYHVMPCIITAFICAQETFADAEVLLNFLRELRHYIVPHQHVKTSEFRFSIDYFENLFRAVFLFHHLKELDAELSIPFLIKSQPNSSTYHHLISNIPDTDNSETGFMSPSKKIKLNSQPQSLFKNVYQLSQSHRRQLYKDLIVSALENSDVKSAILLAKLRIENEGICNDDKISLLTLQILSKFPLIISNLQEPIYVLTQLEELMLTFMSGVNKEELVNCTSLLLRIRLMKDVIFQSEFEIKPKLSQQQQKEARKLFRNHSYLEKGYILDKNSAINCLLTLSKRNPSISPTDSATALVTFKNLFLPQTALSYLLLSLYSTRTLTVSPTLHIIPSSLITSLLRNSHIDITYILSLILCLPDDEAKKELFAYSHRKTSSPSWFLSIAWIGFYYQELVALHSFTSYATNAISIGQYVTYIRYVTKHKIDSQSNQWTPDYILDQLANPLFSPAHVLRAAQLFSLNADKELLLWIQTAVQNRWELSSIREAVCLLEERFESLHSLYQSGEISHYQGIKFVLDSIIQLEHSNQPQLLLYKAICLVTFLISSQAPFLIRSTEPMGGDCEPNSSLLNTDQLTFNDLLGDNPWSLIKDFLTFQYLDIYLGLTAFLDIKSDHIISNTIKAEVTKSTSQAEPLCIQQVKPYLEKLETREIQIAASKWLGSNMQLIEDRMGAILFAIESAEQWKKETSVVTEIQKACEAHEKLQTYYNMLRVKMWLNELGINEDNISTEMYQEPRELIKVLTTSYCPETIYQCTKLYQITKDICSLFSLDIDTVLSDAISSLISNQKEIRNWNSSFTFYIEGDEEDLTANLDLTSNIYTQLIVLLSAHSHDIHLHVNNLINIAIRDSKSHSYTNRKAAIQLSVILISRHSSQEIHFNTFVMEILSQVKSQFNSVSSEENYSVLLSLLLELLCIVEELELLGYPMGIATFLQSNKLAVIQGLVRNFAESFQAFELAARIGMLLYTKVSDAIWQEILERLCSYKRYPFVLSLLPKLTKHISSDIITPLTYNILTQIDLSQNLNLFPHFVQLAHNFVELSTSLKQEDFINSIAKFVNELRGVGQESYAQILELLIRS